MTERFDGLTVVEHQHLSEFELVRMRALFDDEYLASHGPWSPVDPYGYAGHDVHVLARQGGRLVGHVGWARREIRVGGTELTIAGVGGVLVAPSARGKAVGHSLMHAAAESMLDAGGIDFGYLGCREVVAPFYAACDWTRIAAREQYTDRLTGEIVAEPPGPPLFITGVSRNASNWPSGPIDLRGKPW